MSVPTYARPRQMSAYPTHGALLQWDELEQCRNLPNFRNWIVALYFRTVDFRIVKVHRSSRRMRRGYRFYQGGGSPMKRPVLQGVPHLCIPPAKLPHESHRTRHTQLRLRDCKLFKVVFVWLDEPEMVNCHQISGITHEAVLSTERPRCTDVFSLSPTTNRILY